MNKQEDDIYDCQNISKEEALMLRGEVFATSVPLYQIGAAIGVHPCTLGQMLLGRVSMHENIAWRVREVLKQIKSKHSTKVDR